MASLRTLLTIASTVCLASEADKLSAETVCSKDSMRLLAPSVTEVVASGKEEVEEAFLEQADTLLLELDPEPTVLVSDFGLVNMDLEEAEGGDLSELS